MTTSARRAARAAESSTWFRRSARAGFAANGVVHIAVGVVIVVVAAGGRAESDQTGAFRAIAAAPLGFVALWTIAVALWALAAWHLLQAVTARGRDRARRWGRIVSESGQTAAFAAIGVVAAIVAAGARPDGEESTEGASRGILSVPGGPLLLVAIGVAVGVAGVAFVVMGVRRSFRKKMRIPNGRGGAAISALGLVGFVAKGGALLVIGVLLVVAAARVEPETAGGLDGAVRALLQLPAGPVLAWAAGLGFVAYGAFCGFRAVYARLDA